MLHVKTVDHKNCTKNVILDRRELAKIWKSSASADAIASETGSDGQYQIRRDFI